MSEAADGREFCRDLCEVKPVPSAVAYYPLHCSLWLSQLAGCVMEVNECCHKVREQSMKIWLAISEGDSEPVAGRPVSCWRSVAGSVAQLHRQSHHLQTPAVRAELGVGRSQSGRAGAGPSPSAGRTERLMSYCVKPVQPDLGVCLSVTLGS